MALGETHPQSKTFSSYEYEVGKYALPVVMVPGSPGIAGVEMQGTSAAGSTTNQGNPVRIGAKYKATPTTRTNGETSDLVTDESENLKVTDATLRAGEDGPNDVQKVELRYVGQLVAADTLVKTGVGELHALTFSCNDAAPTAGSIIVYDNTAESGTQLFNHTFTTTPFVPFTLPLNMGFTIGLYIGFTTTNDVNVSVSFR